MRDGPPRIVGARKENEITGLCVGAGHGGAGIVQSLRVGGDLVYAGFGQAPADESAAVKAVWPLRAKDVGFAQVFCLLPSGGIVPLPIGAPGNLVHPHPQASRAGCSLSRRRCVAKYSGFRYCPFLMT
jgi:hypothetical protein